MTSHNSKGEEEALLEIDFASSSSIFSGSFGVVIIGVRGAKSLSISSCNLVKVEEVLKFSLVFCCFELSSIIWGVDIWGIDMSSATTFTFLRLTSSFSTFAVILSWSSSTD